MIKGDLQNKMSLHEYDKKRDFARTPEPAGNVDRQKKKREQTRRTSNLRFVVQKHEARRLHYDFRLETNDGTLKSWAVPKGVSIDPKEKRLAVLTEDHPLDYLLFEGVIPKGNYGAGTVIVWDTGTYTILNEGQDISEQFQNGKITFDLNGQKLKGRFSLIKTSRENQWLLIKANDEFASEDEDLTTSKPHSVLSEGTNQTLRSSIKPRRKGKNLNDAVLKGTIIQPLTEEFPTSIKPMLARLVSRPFNNKDWVFEVKWDGVRSFLFFDKANGLTKLQSRSGNEITHRYPEILESSKEAIESTQTLVVDGEIVVFNKEGHPDFQNHQGRMNVDNDVEIQILSRQIPATYYLFDILYLNGRNLQDLSFLQRRRILSDIIKTNERIRISEYIEEVGVQMFEKIKSMNLEGIIAKNLSSKYLQGTEFADWLKIKNIRTQDCVVIGYTTGEGNRENFFGSLILAVYDSGELKFAGHTGSGFNFDQLEKTYRKLEAMKIERCPIKYVPYTNRKPVWIKPELVVEVKFNEWTNEKIMRAPIFLRFREDKSPEECLIEREKQTKEIVVSDGGFTVPPNISTSAFSFSNLDKVFWDKTKEHSRLTKKDLIDYYDKISDYILPHLKDRPLSLSRYPDGIKGKHFYHKNWDQKTPDYVERVKVYSQSRDTLINYIVCNNKETLLWLANLGCIEMHPWYSRVNDFNACKDMTELDEDKCGLNLPDFIIFDLDPYIYSGNENKGEEPEYNIKAFKMTVSVAYHLKELFDALKIKSYVKTSGKTGLHIFVPISNSYTYDQTRTFAEVIGKELMRKYPEKITMEWDTTNRKDKVFFDHYQNAKGKTIASIFSARPTIAATVSMPIAWNKLWEAVLADFNLLNVPGILKSAPNPWDNLLEEKQDINEILERI